MSIQDPNEQNFTAPSTPAYDPVTGAPYAGPAGGPPIPPYPGYQPQPGSPNPLLAGLLGFIPGVGAMYNGQFAKGLAHIAVFAVFTSFANHVSEIFGLFVALWEIYMAVEAYQTAMARRDGRPLPDPFGFNNIGERFGFHTQQHPDLNNAWARTVGKMPGAAPFAEHAGVDPVTGAAYATRTDASGAASTYQVDPSGNVYTPTASAVPPPIPPYGSQPYGGYDPSAYGAPYGVPPPPPPASPYGMPPVPPMPPMPPARQGGLPTGALWLIGLGFFALLGSLHPFSFLEGPATGGLFLMALAVFLFFRRWSAVRSMASEQMPALQWANVGAYRGAATLFVVGLLTLLQGLGVVRWSASWPFLLIFLGLAMVVERIGQNRAVAAAAYPTYADSVAPTTDSTSILPRYGSPVESQRDASTDTHDGEGRQI